MSETPDDEAVLGALESDLAAVESALATLERIASEGPGGEAAAAQIAAVVSRERFPLESDEPTGA